MAILIKTTGQIEEVNPKSGKHFSLGELQSFVDGRIEMPRLPSGRILVLNEEGKLNGLPINGSATELWRFEFPIEKYPNNNDELIVGDVLLISKTEELEK